MRRRDRALLVEPDVGGTGAERVAHAKRPERLAQAALKREVKARQA